VFKDEAIKYCTSDVMILMQACMKFRKIFMTETLIDPFEASLTIASACNLVYRKLFLKRNTIAIVPHNGYRAKEKQSAIGATWLRWLNTTENLGIQASFNGGESQIGPFKVDGLCGDTIYELYGC